MDYYLEHFDVHCKQVITNLPALSFSIFSCHSHVLLILECQQSRESQGPTLTSVNTSSWPRCHIRTLWKTFRTQSSPCLMNHEPHSQALHVLFEICRLKIDIPSLLYALCAATDLRTTGRQEFQGTTNGSQKTSRYVNTCQTSKATDTLLWEIGWNCHDSKMPPGLTSRVTRDNKSTLSGWLPAWKKQLPQTGRQAPQQKTRYDCGMVSLRKANIICTICSQFSQLYSIDWSLAL